VARGALYHHFKDKADLFAAVCEALHAEAAAAITAVVTTEAEQGTGALGRLVAGCDAWLDYMSTGAARRILVLEAPAVLGWERWNDLDRRYGFGLLREGVRAAQQEGSLPDIPTDELAILLNGAVNYAALTMRAQDSAAQLEQRKRAVHTLLYALESHAGLSQPPNRDPNS
jgi:AcrR family transcriptional regulator